MSFDPNNQVGRVLTLRVVIKDHDASRELWEAFGKNKPLAGCSIRAMGDGDIFDERDKYKAIADAAINNERDDGDEPYEVKTKCGKMFFRFAYGVFSTSEIAYDQGEWFASYADLKEKYELEPE